MILYKTKESEVVRIDGGSDGQSLKKYSTTVTGDGTKTVFTIEHNLGTEDILFEMNDGIEPVLIDYAVIDKDNVNITFAVAPTANETYHIKIYGVLENSQESAGNNTVNPPKIGTINTANADWNYTLDDTNGIITLNYYTGNAEDVIVYGTYNVDGSKTYKTNLASNMGNNINYMFAGNKTVKNIIFNDDLDTSTCTNMSYMFYYCNSLISINLSNFNTSNVTDMDGMFFYCESLTNLDISSFDTSNVTDMTEMFDGCKLLASLDVTNFNTENVTSMKGCFSHCKLITTIDLNNFNTNNVTNMQSLFYGCTSLSTLDLRSFDTRNTTYMEGMFYDCTSLTSILATNDKWVTSHIPSIHTNAMFEGCGVSSITYV